MAELVQQQVLPAPFIEAAAKPYLQELTSAVGDYKQADLSKIFGPQFIAGQDQLTKDAQALAQQGIGAYKPFLTSAAASTGPTAYQQFMSPYQQDVIDTTLAEFDVQAAKGIPGIAAQAVSKGVLGGGREGVMRAEYGAASDRNRAALQAQLLGQGFAQAQQAAQQNMQNQLQLGTAQQGFMGQDVGALSTLGAANQAQAQSILSAQQQLAQQQLNQPLTAAQTLGQGITSLIAGYPGQTTQQISPSPSFAQTALGTGATLAGIYRGFTG